MTTTASTEPGSTEPGGSTVSGAGARTYQQRLPDAVPAVRTQDLVKTFGDNRAVDGVNLEIRPGEVFGVLGPNGAGKTTVLRMVATLLQIDGGRAEVFGVDVAKNPHVIRQLIGVTGQYASVDEELTAKENLWLFGRLQGLSSRRSRQIAGDLIDRFGLSDAADRRLSQFSGGMRRRLDLAASLITQPPLIFLDEPTTGLDPRTRGQMWDTVRDLVADGCTVLLTTQYLDEADQLSDRLAVIDHGRIVAEGTSNDLKASVGSSTLQMRLADPGQLSTAQDAIRRLLRADPVLSPEHARINVALGAVDEAADVLIALRSADVSLAEVTVQKPSLDEVFLALTGQGAGEAATDADTGAATNGTDDSTGGTR